MDILKFLSLAINEAAPITIAAMGGIFSIRLRIFNFALEGFMLIGAFSSIVGASITGSVFGGILFAALITTIMILIYAFFILETGMEQIICAVAMIAIASGLTRYLLIPFFKTSGRVILSSSLALPVIKMPWLESIPVIGTILNGHTILVYIALVLPFLIHILFYKTSAGLSIRAIGLNFEAADSAGIHTKKVRYVSLMINGLLCGLAGAQLALSINMFNIDMINGRGFTAFAAIIMTGAEPILTLLACLLFGLSSAFVLTFSGKGYPTQILSMLPYVLALLAVILPRLIQKLKINYKQTSSAKKIIIHSKSDQRRLPWSN